eukprot:CAMPEP_0170229610 /NCGR_PEP_ID=MMETSP0116_2-20130129/14530_1 /TAXON_ID=400756 /ORGANISM="Durinskia baltica, Strain CSIRO CS-38" /LENGTH=77 /DNA_ID=CAMNT_0010480363 /DNA_START=604 /DNA_END=837 /DNA_ORIENTATION=-
MTPSQLPLVVVTGSDDGRQDQRVSSSLMSPLPSFLSLLDVGYGRLDVEVDVDKESFSMLDLGGGRFGDHAAIRGPES